MKMTQRLSRLESAATMIGPLPYVWVWSWQTLDEALAERNAELPAGHPALAADSVAFIRCGAPTGAEL